MIKINATVVEEDDIIWYTVLVREFLATLRLRIGGYECQPREKTARAES